MADLFSRFIVDTSSFVGAINTVTQAVQNLSRGATTAAQTMQTSLTQTEAAAQRVAGSLLRTVTAAADLARAANQTAAALGAYSGAAGRATTATALLSAETLAADRAMAATAAMTARMVAGYNALGLAATLAANQQVAAATVATATVATNMAIWYNQMAFNARNAAAAAAAVGTAAAGAAPALAQNANLMAALTSASALAVGPLSGIGARVSALSTLMSHGNLVLGLFVAGFAVMAFTLYKVSKASLEAAISFDRIQRTLTAATGSSEAASAAYDHVRDVVVRLGLDLESSSLQFAKLAAASKGTALEGAGVQRIFEAVATASAVLGLSSEQTGGALQAIQQMMSKGTVQAEELRGQLGERLPGAFKLAADAMGLTTRELGKLLETGRVISDEFLPKLADVLLKTFGPRADEASKSFQASLSRLGTAFFELGVNIGEFLKGPAQKFVDWLTDTVNIINETVDPGGIPALERKLKALLAIRERFKERLPQPFTDVDRAQRELVRTQLFKWQEEFARLRREGVGVIGRAGVYDEIKRLESLLSELDEKERRATSRRVPGAALLAGIASTEHALEQLYERNLQLATAASKNVITSRLPSPEEIQARQQALKTELTERLESLEIEDAKRKFLVASWELMDREALTHELAIIQARRDALDVWFRQAKAVVIEEHGNIQAEIDKIAKTPEDQLTDYLKARRQILPEMLKNQQKDLDALKARRDKASSDIEKAHIAVEIKGVELTRENQAKTQEANEKIAAEQIATNAKYMDVRGETHVKLLSLMGLEYEASVATARREYMARVAEASKYPEIYAKLIALAAKLEDEQNKVNEKKRIEAFRKQMDAFLAPAMSAAEALTEAQMTEMEKVERAYEKHLIDLGLLQKAAAEAGIPLDREVFARMAVLLRIRDLGRAEARAKDYKDINDEVVAKIKADQTIMEHRIGNLRVINTAEERAAKQRAELLQETSRQTGDVYGFMVATVEQALLDMGTSWDVLGRLIKTTFDTLRSSLADAFEAMLDNTKKMSDVWKTFLNRLKRSIAEFMADQLVRVVLGTLFGVGIGPGGTIVAAGPGGAQLPAAGGYGAFAGGGVGGTPVSANGTPMALQGAGALYAAYTAFPGFANLGANYAVGGFQGAAFGVSGAQSAANVGGIAYINAYNAAIDAGHSAAQAVEMARSAQSLAVSTTSTAGTQGLVGAGGAGLGTAYSNALGIGSKATGVQQAGAVIRALVEAYVVGTKIAEIAKNPGYSKIEKAVLAMDEIALGYASFMTFGLSRFISDRWSLQSLFFKPSIPHEVREAMELQRTLGQAAGFQGEIAAAKTLPDLWTTLLRWQSGYAGGTSPLAIGVGARNVPAEQLLNPQVVGPGGAYASWLTGGAVSAAGVGPAGTYYPVIGQQAFFQTARTRPRDVFAGIQAGIEPSMLAGPNATLVDTIIAQVKFIDDLTAAIVKALDDLLTDAIRPAPATLQAVLDRSTETFRELMTGLTTDLDARLSLARNWLLGLTDPEEILTQVNTVKGLIQERYQTEIDVVRSFVSELDKAAAAWGDLAKSIGDQITALQESNLGPETNPSFLVGRTKGRFEDALAAFRASATPENAAALSALAQPYLEAVSAIWTRPSGEYRAIFESVTGALDEARLKAKDTETMFRDAMSSALGGLESVEKLVERNTALMAIDLANLRIDAANVFQALGFDIPGGSLTDVLRQLIEQQQAIVAATVVPVAPPDQLAFLSMIAINTGRTAEALGGRAADEAAAEGLQLELAARAQNQSDQFGRAFVPYDNYVTRLHRGERILTADEAREMDRGGSGVVFEAGAIVINGADSRTSGEIVDEIERRIRFGTLGEAIRRRVKPAGV